MLNIYIGKQDLPKNKTFLFDTEAIVDMLDLLKDNFTARILAEIEQATAYSKNKFYDRFGGGLYSSNLSTTCKILLGVYQTDIIMNGTELGINGYKLLCEFDRGNIYFDVMMCDIYPQHYPINVNGSICSNLSEYKMAVLEAYT